MIEELASVEEKPPAHVSYNGQTFLADSTWLEADIRKEVLPESLLVFYQPFSEWKPASDWLYAIELDELNEPEELEKEEHKPATPVSADNGQGPLSRLIDYCSNNGVVTLVAATVIMVPLIYVYEEFIKGDDGDYASQQEEAQEGAVEFTPAAAPKDPAAAPKDPAVAAIPTTTSITPAWLSSTRSDGLRITSKERFINYFKGKSKEHLLAVWPSPTSRERVGTFGVPEGQERWTYYGSSFGRDPKKRYRIYDMVTEKPTNVYVYVRKSDGIIVNIE